MAKKSLAKCLSRALKKRPILAFRYRVTTALYRGTDSDEPARVTAHKGICKIDFVAIAAALLASRAFFKVLAYWLKKRKKK